jgi:hypothetical protein
MNMPNEASRNSPPSTPLPRWVRILCTVLLVGLALGVLILVIRAGRRTGPALALAAGSALAARPGPHRDRGPRQAYRMRP